MFRAFVALLLVTAFPALSMAETNHVVSQSDLQQQLVTASQLRAQNIQKVEQFLSTDAAAQAMQSAHVNAQQVKNAVPSLSDQELAQLASRANTAQSAFAAGSLGTRDIAIVVLGIVVIILIIVVSH
ncbi:MAG TPA: PA2779 family protein [Terriglobales bacterium]|nr:PA2779 family protein [Terriglobales bacterium]